MKRNFIKSLVMSLVLLMGVRQAAFAQQLFTVNVPEGAVAAVYNQEANYKTVKLDAVSTQELDDGTTDYTFDVENALAASYRATCEGELTEAGYLGEIESDRIVVDFAEKTETVRKSWQEASVLLNINERNRISLAVDESFTLRAYRAPWQIVNDTVSNTMIEPDFNYTVLSGEDVIKIETLSNGNAGDNKAVITALSEGVAIVEVSCDAIYVDSIYPASPKERCGIAVITVGDGYGDIEALEWDSEYDTLYFTGERGELTIANTELTAEVAAVGNTLGEWTVCSADENGITVPVSQGNNILKISDGEKTDYRVIRGAKLTVNIDDLTDGKAGAGDTVTVSFDGLYQPLPKMSAIYNPAYYISDEFPEWNSYGMQVCYTLADTDVKSVGTQYNLIEKEFNCLSVTIPEDAQDKITLQNGKITGSVWGSAYGSHRFIGDEGLPPDFSAPGGDLKPILLPDIEIAVADDTSEDDDDNYGYDDSDHTVTGGIDRTHTTSYYSTVIDKFNDITDADGYVKISFEDKGKRNESCDFKTPLGVIISATEVPYYEGESVAKVTLRLLDALGIGYKITGSADENFYLSAIKNFRLSDGYKVSSFGQSDGGSMSGWMVSVDGDFLSVGASDCEVSDGDVIKWQFSCQLGKDIGDRRSGGSLSQVTTEKEEEKTEENTAFTDIDGNVYKKQIEELAQKGIISGYGDGTFAPEKELTRAEFATIIVKAIALEEDAVSVFEDVKEDAWYYSTISAAYKNGIVMGMSETIFSPDTQVTREQGMAFAIRAMKLLDAEMTAAVIMDEGVSIWAISSVSYCVGSGLIDTESGIRPQDNLTRGEAANLVYNLLENIEK